MLLSKRMDKLIEFLSSLLVSKGWKLVAAESCTGGQLAAHLTSFAGSSDWFEASLVTYSELAKMRLLGVSDSTLKSQGAVSEACALEMVEGCVLSSHNLSIAITGFAGPSGGSEHYPVGTVFIACKTPDGLKSCEPFMFWGKRHEVVLQAVYQALKKAVLASLNLPSYQDTRYFFSICVEDLVFKEKLFKHALAAGFSLEQMEPVSNWHFTIAYMGSVGPKVLEELKTKADAWSKSVSTFDLAIDGLTYWPKASVYVYSLTSTPDSLKKLSMLAPQQDFTPHLTISKRAGVSPDTIRLSSCQASLKVNKFSLMASIGGLFYVQQEQWFLK